jgi:hypothetical protein
MIVAGTGPVSVAGTGPVGLHPLQFNLHPPQFRT